MSLYFCASRLAACSCCSLVYSMCFQCAMVCGGVRWCSTVSHLVPRCGVVSRGVPWRPTGRSIDLLYFVQVVFMVRFGVSGTISTAFGLIRYSVVSPVQISVVFVHHPSRARNQGQQRNLQVPTIAFISNETHSNILPVAVRRVCVEGRGGFKGGARCGRGHHQPSDRHRHCFTIR